MTSPFDANDLMKRSLLSSIMGFKKKLPRQNTEGAEASTSSSCRSLPLVQTAIERTPHDIYKEIVCECEQIERSRTSSPLSDFGSCPTSPINRPVAPTSPFVATAYTVDGSFPPRQHTLPDHHERNQVQPQFAVPPLCFAPPAYSNTPSTVLPVNNMYSTSSILLSVPTSQEVFPCNIKQEGNPVSIEEIVKLVVSAMRDSGLGDSEKESPEEILRRKRHQNNLAAARYRKRQREAREHAEGELDHLARRNESLRRTVERMELEIEQLKNAVLFSNRE